jgi:hypothetical protein
VVEALQEVVGPPLEVNPWQLVACWQVAWEGSVVLLLLELGGTFPDEAPTITVQSLRWVAPFFPRCSCHIYQNSTP